MIHDIWEFRSNGTNCINYVRSSLLAPGISIGIELLFLIFFFPFQTFSFPLPSKMLKSNQFVSSQQIPHFINPRKSPSRDYQHSSVRLLSPNPSVELEKVYPKHATLAAAFKQFILMVQMRENRCRLKSQCSRIKDRYKRVTCLINQICNHILEHCVKRCLEVSVLRGPLEVLCRLLTQVYIKIFNLDTQCSI